jgi:hypothetical protein
MGVGHAWYGLYFLPWGIIGSVTIEASGLWLADVA